MYRSKSFLHVFQGSLQPKSGKTSKTEYFITGLFHIIYTVALIAQFTTKNFIFLSQLSTNLTGEFHKMNLFFKSLGHTIQE